MPASADVRAHGQRDSWFIWSTPEGREVVLEGVKSWPLAQAKEIAAQLGEGHQVLHTLTWVDEKAHAQWAQETDYGNRPGRNTMPR